MKSSIFEGRARVRCEPACGTSELIAKSYNIVNLQARICRINPKRTGRHNSQRDCDARDAWHASSFTRMRFPQTAAWMLRGFAFPLAAITLHGNVRLSFAVGPAFEVPYPLLAWIS